jgi:hypothetical protein
MKSQNLKKILLKTTLLKAEAEITVLNTEYLQNLYGGRALPSECTTKSGACPDLTKCGTYGVECNGKCGTNNSTITPSTGF